MFRLHCRTFRRLHFSRKIPYSSSSSSPPNVRNPQITPSNPPPTLLNHQKSPNYPSLSPLPQPPSRKPVLALSTAALSAVIAVAFLLNDQNPSNREIYSRIEHAIETSNASVQRLMTQMNNTRVAASVLWQSLRSVMSSANHEVRVGFELRVAALLADIVASNASRRVAIVGAGGGRVLDWLLETVSVSGGAGTQAEAARALAHLLADERVCGDVLGRPKAVPNLLRFIFSCQPQNSNGNSKKHSRRSSFDVSDSLKGRSMLVTAIMDIVTANCDNPDKVSFHPSLPENAEIGDIAAAIEVVENGGMHLDDQHDDDDDGEKGIKGIGMKVIGGTTVLGLSRTSGLMKLGHFDDDDVDFARHVSPVYQQKHNVSVAHANSTSAVVPGLWDDLDCQHVAVPFATWALANWAKASGVNRCHIQELDQDGHAVMNALMAPERSVKWHGSLVARLLLEDSDLPLSDSVSDWSTSLLSTISHASKTEDISLAQVALSAFLKSVERSEDAQKAVVEKGLHRMREIAKQTTKHKNVQEALSKVLELLGTCDARLSLEESKKWSGILLLWAFRKNSSDSLRLSATNILSRILEDHGPSSVPISQGWLAIMLTEILASSKINKGTAQDKADKVKTQIDQANMLSAAQTTSQIAGAVVNLAVNHLGTATDTVDTFSLADLLALEPFRAPLKNLNKDKPPKFDAADSAVATLKGIKALTELCAEDPSCQNKIVDFGVLCVLRRFLLRDDYEKLAAIEAYDDASRSLEAQDRNSNGPGESSVLDTNDPFSVRVPPTAHIRRHASRLLTNLSLLPNVQKTLIGDKIWCKWLDDCANGKIAGCSDFKTQSYARATLLNIFCNNEIIKNGSNDNDQGSGSAKHRVCPRYNDVVFLINPEMPHWKCPEENESESVRRKPFSKKQDNDNKSSSTDVELLEKEKRDSEASAHCSPSDVPLLDIVFIHGLRGGPYKTWRISEDKSSTKSGLVEKIDQEAGKQGTFWPREWLASDFPQARLFTLKYKTNLTQWSGASLPLQEVSSMLLEKLVAAGIGDRPVVFITHSMGGLVVKQLLDKARAENIDNFVNNTVGVVFYSCPHFGSRLADMPWRMGLVFRPAPSIGELRSGSPRLVELNDFVRGLHKKGLLNVLSFCETKVTPIVEGYGGWALRMEIVPIESAYPGFGDLVVLESTDHINSCKPLSRTDPSYTETLEFLHKLKAQLSGQTN